MLIAIALAGCGRFSFDPLPTASDAAIGGDGPVKACTSFGPFGDAEYVPSLATPGIDDYEPILTPDGTQIFMTHEDDNQIWTATRTGDLTFTAPTLATTLNSGGVDADLFITRDGLSLFLTSPREGAVKTFRATRNAVGEAFTNPVAVTGATNVNAMSLDPTEHFAFKSVNGTLQLSTFDGSAFVDVRSIDELAFDDQGVQITSPQYDLTVSPDNRAFWIREKGASAPSVWTADWDPATQQFSNQRVWEGSMEGVGEHGVHISHDGTELWLSLNQTPAVGGSDIFVSRRACLE